MILKVLQYLCLRKTFKKFTETALCKIRVSFPRSLIASQALAFVVLPIAGCSMSVNCC